MIYVTYGSKLQESVLDMLYSMFKDIPIFPFKTTHLACNHDSVKDLVQETISLLPRDPSKVHGIVLVGGADISPVTLGQNHPITEFTDNHSARDIMELALLDYAIFNKIPVLAICRGFQLLCASAGCTVIHNLEGDVAHSPSRFPGGFKSDNDIYRHTITPLTEDLVDDDAVQLVDRNVSFGLWVNSYHHQGIQMTDENVAALAKFGLDVIATSPLKLGTAPEYADKVDLIEAVKSEFIIGVQWHPEYHFTMPMNRGIMDIFKERIQSFFGINRRIGPDINRSITEMYEKAVRK